MLSFERVNRFGSGSGQWPLFFMKKFFYYIERENRVLSKREMCENPGKSAPIEDSVHLRRRANEKKIGQTSDVFEKALKRFKALK